MPSDNAQDETKSELTLTASVSTNAPVFKQILDLHVRPGSRIADVTYGKGAFWRDVDASKYELLATDLQTGTDCRDLSYEDATIDVVVLDPPYMEGLHRSSGQLAGSGSHAAFRSRYSNGAHSTEAVGTAAGYHGRVLKLYLEAAHEALRVLKRDGLLIVKCQDEVSANRQWWTHVELMTSLEDNFYCKDLFVVVRSNKPSVSGMKRQVHARKNHSYFLVFVKK